MGYAIRYRLRGSVGLCVGIAAGNALYIVLAIIGWGCCARRRCCLPSSSCWGGIFVVDWQPAAESRPSTLAPDEPRLHARRWQNSFCWGWVLRCSIPKTPCFIWR
jgi:threonine/homoserine/homoserine lactone efflux protein